jgi:segregation and condensation protein A
MSEVMENVEHLIEKPPTLTTATPCYGFVRGLAVTELPADLYIPPDAMEVVLELFEGPLDLLLYLIKKHNLDILNIPVAEITRQYMEYVGLMSVFRLELAADYLEMAALLAEIKSRMLLPRPKEEAEQDVDPRAELIRRLQEYERFKKAAEALEALPRLERDIYVGSAALPEYQIPKPVPQVDLKEVLLAFREILKKVELQSVHTVQKEALSLRERMSRVLSLLVSGEFVHFSAFFDVSEGRLGVVVSFMAILELVKEAMIELVQREAFGPIYVRGI